MDLGLHPGQQVSIINRLDDKFAHPQLHAFGPRLHIISGREQNNGQRWEELFEFRTHGQSIHLWHHDVEDHDINRLFPHDF